MVVDMGLMNNEFPIRRLQDNNRGKDYVVGDLHGCFSLLERLLEAVDFDPNCDRLFSVGDLIDRGPDSLRCLELLAEPWFFAVQGNHEYMLLDFFWPYISSGKLERFEDINDTGFLVYGGAWVEKYFEVERQGMSEEFDLGLKRVLDLPMIWVVGEGQNRFHVIHAELVRPNFMFSDQLVWLDSDIDSWFENKDIELDIQDSLFWGRILWQSRSAAVNNTGIQSGLSTTFCGHTFASRPRQVLSHLCIDTGGFITLETRREVKSDFGLTLFDVQESRWCSSSYRRTGIISEKFQRK